MSHIPVISGRKCVKALEKIGFVFKRQRGSHMILKRQSPPCRVSVPDHKPMKTGTLYTIIKEAGLTVDEFKELL